MPRDGAVVLPDLRNPTLSIVCEPCGRRGTYDVARLMEQHGDAKLTNLLQTLTNCPKARGGGGGRVNRTRGSSTAGPAGYVCFFRPIFCSFLPFSAKGVEPIWPTLRRLPCTDRGCGRVSAAASRRFRISFSAFRVSMAASSTRRSARSSGIARGVNAGMTASRRPAMTPYSPSGLGASRPFGRLSRASSFSSAPTASEIVPSRKAASPTRRDVRARARRPTAARRRWR